MQKFTEMASLLRRRGKSYFSNRALLLVKAMLRLRDAFKKSVFEA